MKQPLARAFGGEAFWLRRVETALIPMLPLPIPFFFFFSLSLLLGLLLRSSLFYSGVLSTLVSLPSIPSVAVLVSPCPGPTQPVPNTPQNKVPARRNRGLFPSPIFGSSFYCLSRKKQQQCFSLFLYLCQSFSSSILPACHDQRHVFTDSVGCGAQCLRLPLWWWP